MNDPVFIDKLGRRYRAMPGRPRQRTRLLFVRVVEEEVAAVKALADYNQTTVSDLMRDAINSIASECGYRRIFPPS